jgi:hypothetical protein
MSAVSWSSIRAADGTATTPRPDSTGRMSPCYEPLLRQRAGHVLAQTQRCPAVAAARGGSAETVGVPIGNRR